MSDGRQEAMQNMHGLGYVKLCNVAVAFRSIQVGGFYRLVATREKRIGERRLGPALKNAKNA